MNETYNIIRIEDGVEVPLAAEMPNHSLGTSTFIIVVFLIAVLVIFILIYIVRCYGYRKRIKELQQINHKEQGIKYKLNWNLFRLRDVEEQIKSNVASSIQVE